MLGKVRPTTHRENGVPQPRVGLSDARLALVHRYMIDAEEAEAKARVDAELEEARARREAEELDRIQLEMERRRNAGPSVRAAASEPNVESPPQKEQLPPARHEPKTVAPLQSARTYKEIVREEARRMAALEKKEARERKALAKAAARRRGERQLRY